LLDCVLRASDVSTNVNLDKILKSYLGHKKLSHIRTSSDYLDHFRKNVFVMIMQLGPPTFFVTFTTSVYNWPILIKTLKELYDQYIGENLRIKKDDSLSIKKIVKNGLVTCACYYEHIMNIFHKLIIDLIFGKVKDYFFITEFQ
jgi:hypothetical protein